MFLRLFEQIKRRISLLIGRGILVQVNNSEKTQKMQMAVHADETVTDIERIQEYGIETYPWHMHKANGIYSGADPNTAAETESVILFQNGDRGRGFVLVVGDRYYRLTDLAQGEVALYTYKDKETAGHRIHLKADGSIEVKGTAINITVTGNATINTGGDASIVATGSANVTASGGINLDGGTSNCLGAVTGASICHFTGAPHADISTNVKASK